MPIRFVKAAGLLLWLLVIALPLLALAVESVSSPAQPDVVRPVMAALLRTCVLAGVVAATAVLLGWLPGKLLGTSGAHTGLLLLLLLLPLVLPQYVLYYAWTLLLSPTTQLGRLLASRPDLARLVGVVTSTGVLIGWYWPLAALVLAQGWRSIDGRIWEGAALEATRSQVLRHVALPLLSRTTLLAFGVCFVLSLSEFAAFHLAGVQTVGTELAVLYELTGAAAPVARAAWPVTLPALLAALALTLSSHHWMPATVTVKPSTVGSRSLAWTALLLLLVVSWLAPVVLLVANVTTWQPFRQFLMLHVDDLAWSLLTAGVAALLAYLIALGGFCCSKRRTATLLVCGTTFLAMFLPASLSAVSLLKLSGSVAPNVRNWFLVSAGQASRFAGLALVLLLLMRYPDRRQLAEMASLDGASPLRAWRHVHLPRVWPVLAGTFLLVTMLAFAELPATMILLPAGLPNFAQRLLNQMHYARDQQVIASCLILMLLFVVVAAVSVALLRMASTRRWLPVLLVLAIAVSGCGRKVGASEPKVIETFGKTGAGPGEFLYPRAIALDGNSAVLVVDKTGRIQRFSQEGQSLSTIQMPLIEAGKPTGMSLHKDGRLFVADTHYSRVVIFSHEGQQIGEFGKYGQEGGCFIYPTDVAFAPDGRIFVSEYGGNDRISVFTAEGDFLFSFGSPGTAEGQLARPAALCMDEGRGCLYVADACNHRIGVYDLNGHLLRYIGSAGLGPGELRYPYGLSLLDDGTIVVCEYGNNRLQLFSPEGKSLAIYGRAGRRLGQLAYPWAVAVDAHRRAFVVDAGNNRIQVWQL
ncbi:MAG: SMP-30/gluconolactonase/LRE family protein [Planctomycetes bacterium]|nr:SMP-30/gluconolactonase/LRE family protein [Planctomycetota bacterium]